MTRQRLDPPSVVETKVVHDAHRRATSLLADLTTSGAAPADAVVELRDLLVGMLRHHHGSEDGDLWPMLLRADGSLADPLAALTREHHRLDDALDRLAADGHASSGAAVEVRDLIHEHLDHEEPVLFPALRAHVSDDDWAGFSQRTVAAAPQEGTHLLVGFFDDVAPRQDVDLIFRHLPPEAQAGLPALREAGEQALASLRGALR
jgi:hemerythrin-like domain-containing protein